MFFKQHNKLLKKQIGTIQNVLIEKNSMGHTENFSKIKLQETIQSREII